MVFNFLALALILFAHGALCPMIKIIKLLSRTKGITKLAQKSCNFLQKKCFLHTKAQPPISYRLYAHKPWRTWKEAI